MKLQILVLVLLSFLISNLYSETITKFTDYTLDAADTIKADVKVYNGDAEIKGLLDGNLDVFKGDVRIKDEGKVTGEVRSYAGKVYRDEKMDDEASYYVVEKLKKFFINTNDDKIEDENESYLKISAGNNNKKKGFFFHNSLIKKDFFSYSKAEGLYLGLNTEFNLVESDYADFSMNASAGYAFRMEDWEYYFDQQLSFFDEKLILGGCEYKGVASEDQRKIMPIMNSLSAFLLHQDFYNYYMVEGYGLFLGSIFNKKIGDSDHQLALKTGVYNDGIDALKNKTNWALFFNNRDFIQNFDAYEGKMIEFVSSARYVGKFSAINTTIDTYGTYEKTLDQYDQDFSFKKGLFSIFMESKVKNMLVFSNLMRLESVVSGDGPDSRIVPNFKKIEMGGMGTLPGYRLNEFGGNRGFYDRFVIGFTGIDLTEFRAILDMGEAYNVNSDDLMEGVGKFGFSTMKSSFGLGMTIGDDYMFSVHKRLDSNHNPYQFQFSYIYNY